jgi:anti-anti-sigma factor
VREIQTSERAHGAKGGAGADVWIPRRREGDLRAEAFTIEEHSEGASHTLILRGQLDMAGAPALEGISQQLCEAGAQELVLDLSQLEFIDSSGLKAILSCTAMCEERRCDVTLVPGSGSVQRVFELTRLLDRLPFRSAGEA